MGRFIIKHINNFTPQKHPNVNVSTSVSKVEEKKIEENNKVEENKTVMTTEEKIAMAQEVLDGKPAPSFKRVKKDKGLIERTESSKTILTEDNKELLND